MNKAFVWKSGSDWCWLVQDAKFETVDYGTGFYEFKSRALASLRRKHPDLEVIESSPTEKPPLVIDLCQLISDIENRKPEDDNHLLARIAIALWPDCKGMIHPGIAGGRGSSHDKICFMDFEAWERWGHGSITSHMRLPINRNWLADDGAALELYREIVDWREYRMVASHLNDNVWKVDFCMVAGEPTYSSIGNSLALAIVANVIRFKQREGLRKSLTS